MNTGKYCVVNPKSLSFANKISLAKKIYRQVHQLVFNESKFKDFYKIVFDPPTYLTKIMVFSNDKQVCGYATIQAYQVNVKKKRTFILMSEICFKHQHKALVNNPTLLVLEEMANFAVKHPFTRTFIVDTLISPFIYRRAENMLYQVYPRETAKIPDGLTPVINEVANQFHWDITNHHNTVIRHLHWKLKEDYVHISHKIFLKDHALQFYQELVPDCEEGNGLVIIAPVTMLNIVLSAVKIFILSCKYKLQKIYSLPGLHVHAPKIKLLKKE